MAWLFLFFAGCCEITGVFTMKRWSDSKSPGWCAAMVLNFACSFTFLSLALKTLPMSTAYAIWTGIGTAGSVLVGFLLFHERLRWPQCCCILLIVTGAVGLKLLS